jgi:hypothetical protein
LIPFRTTSAFLLLLLCFCIVPVTSPAQEKPYFVTYSHDLEEPGNLEIENKTAFGEPDGGNQFGSLATELEYGVRAWWTSELSTARPQPTIRPSSPGSDGRIASGP